MTLLSPIRALSAFLTVAGIVGIGGAIHAGRVAATMSGFAVMDRGQPPIVAGEIVGAIGVSSPQPDWDVALARRMRPPAQIELIPG
jgi:hypothetical protein